MAALLPRLLLGGTLGLLPFFVHALGEEIAWRGYLLPKLEQTGWRFPLLWQALIWSQWHLPFLLRLPTQSDAEFLLWFVRFTLGLTLLGIWIGWLFQRTRSVSVATLAHASHNLFLTVWGISLVDGQVLLSQEGWFVLVGYSMMLWIVLRRKHPNLAQ